MDIYTALKKDHDKVRELLTELVSLDPETTTATRHRLIEKIRDDLIPHARAEESVLYNSMRTVEPLSKFAQHGYQEHMAAEAMLRTLQVQDKIDVGWHATAKKLKAALEHHIAEEEGEMFSAARQVFTEEEATMMGEAFEKLKPEIREEGLMTTTVEMIANMMPRRLAKAFSKFNLENRLTKH